MLRSPPLIVAAPTAAAPLSKVVFLPPPPIVSSWFSERLKAPLTIEHDPFAVFLYPPLIVE